MTTTLHIPAVAENQAALAQFFAQMKQMKLERREALVPAQAALGRLLDVCAVQTGQSYKVRALLFSLWNGKPANLSDVLCLDWAIRKDMCAVILGFGAADEFFYDAFTEAFTRRGLFDWFTEEGGK